MFRSQIIHRVLPANKHLLNLRSVSSTAFLSTSQSPISNASVKSTPIHSASPAAANASSTGSSIPQPPKGSSIGFKMSKRDPNQFGSRPIYLDMQATTPTDPRVLDKMLQFYTGFYGNPHSSTHAYGWETDKAIEEARAHVANLINADPKEIIFTSGATECNNMALKGVARFYGKTKKHIITSQTEHKCVLDSCRRLQEEGFEITYLPVDKEDR
ncbi:unnamed protein product [Ambrosiozyma monospora]|uniref:Unnamed protein product n=1 Tax=Ambrosiozyma monospora TaxID=43982 RepID=A0ACB5TV73_AMBMO|nr:unnamed protein product [Ambrosiozyma monospora]